MNNYFKPYQHYIKHGKFVAILKSDISVEKEELYALVIQECGCVDKDVYYGNITQIKNILLDLNCYKNIDITIMN